MGYKGKISHFTISFGLYLALTACAAAIAVVPTGSIAASYTESYSICSPVAHQKAKGDCGWGRVYEHYYQYCMTQSGYGDEEVNEDPDYYKGYMTAYKTCSSQADFNSKEYCRYGDLYNTHYNICMASQGYGPGGEPISTNGSGNSDERSFDFNF